MRQMNVILTTALLLASLGFMTPSFGDQSPRDSGREHGCDDAQIDDSDDRYINQEGKGPSHHTQAFMDGYYQGLRMCADEYVPPSSTSVEVETETTQGQASAQRNTCGNLVLFAAVSCENTAGQGQQN